MAGGFALAVAVGSITGASIKSDQQKEHAIKEFRETSPQEQMAMLEAHKDELLKSKAIVQRKIDLFKERVEERKVEKERERR